MLKDRDLCPYSWRIRPFKWYSVLLKAKDYKYPLKVKNNKKERTEAIENQSYDMEDNYS